MEAEECNFRGLQASALKGSEFLLGIGTVVLGDGRGVEGCPGMPRRKRKVEAQVGVLLVVPPPRWAPCPCPPMSPPSPGSLGGCARSQDVMISRARSSCRCVRMCTRSATRALRLIQGHRTLAVRCSERSHSRSSVWSRTIRAAAGRGASGIDARSPGPRSAPRRPPPPTELAPVSGFQGVHHFVESAHDPGRNLIQEVLGAGNRGLPRAWPPSHCHSRRRPGASWGHGGRRPGPGPGPAGFADTDSLPLQAGLVQRPAGRKRRRSGPPPSCAPPLPPLPLATRGRLARGKGPW